MRRIAGAAGRGGGVEDLRGGGGGRGKASEVPLHGVFIEGKDGAEQGDIVRLVESGTHADAVVEVGLVNDELRLARCGHESDAENGEK